MRRRRFLTRSLAALPLLPAAAARAGGAADDADAAEDAADERTPPPPNGPLPVTAVRVVRLRGTRRWSGQPYQTVTSPAAVYPERRTSIGPRLPDPPPGEGRFSQLYLELDTDGGPTARYGPVDPEAAAVVDRQLRRELLGADGLAGAKRFDLLAKSNRHARAGHYMLAVSAVDNALWDLRGRVFGVPVHRLLGGPTRGDVPAYVSTLGTAVDDATLAAETVRLRDAGWGRQKWFLPHNASSGAAGFAENVRVVRTLREAAGPAVSLRFDVGRGWELNDAVRWCRAVERYDVGWLEEPFPQDDLRAYAALAAKTAIPVACGEHVYNRHEAHRALAAGVRVMQADPEWCGGVSGAAHIGTVCSLHGAPLVPHGHGLHAAVHLAAGLPPDVVPECEYLMRKMDSPDGPGTGYSFFERDPPVAAAGAFPLPTRAGFGIEFDEDRVEDRREVSFGG